MDSIMKKELVLGLSAGAAFGLQAGPAPVSTWIAVDNSAAGG